MDGPRVMRTCFVFALLPLMLVASAAIALVTVGCSSSEDDAARVQMRFFVSRNPLSSSRNELRVYASMASFKYSEWGPFPRGWGRLGGRTALLLETPYD